MKGKEVLSPKTLSAAEGRSSAEKRPGIRNFLTPRWLRELTELNSIYSVRN
jgi:hypothetical protein